MDCACPVKFVSTRKMAKDQGDNSLYPIAVLIDELRNDDVNVSRRFSWPVFGGNCVGLCLEELV